MSNKRRSHSAQAYQRACSRSSHSPCHPWSQSTVRDRGRATAVAAVAAVHARLGGGAGDSPFIWCRHDDSMLGTRSFRAERPRRKGEPVCIQDEDPKENEAPHAHAMRTCSESRGCSLAITARMSAKF
eukprot:scaffold100494_cov66-Phaeocystis_antarctica.AAC.2